MEVKIKIKEEFVEGHLKYIKSQLCLTTNLENLKSEPENNSGSTRSKINAKQCELAEIKEGFFEGNPRYIQSQLSSSTNLGDFGNKPRDNSGMEIKNAIKEGLFEGDPKYIESQISTSTYLEDLKNESEDNSATQDTLESQETVKAQETVQRTQDKFATLAHTSRIRKKRGADDEKLDAAFAVLTKVAKAQEDSDCSEYTIFGKLVASKLKKYSNATASIVQEKIMAVLFQADRGTFEQYIQSPTSSVHSNNSSISTYSNPIPHSSESQFSPQSFQTIPYSTPTYIQSQANDSNIISPTMFSIDMPSLDLN
ncbi:unnamed protein product [Diabrotica balteata]|uniref:BESS domain-containing protein n=1 Tax=Diabrotica balteata TaxID=107213 RepID=A0A9P0DR38_DIABA|nr:unnamed protein product [Diabrotica balteata]